MVAACVHSCECVGVNASLKEEALCALFVHAIFICLCVCVCSWMYACVTYGEYVHVSVSLSNLRNGEESYSGNPTPTSL